MSMIYLKSFWELLRRYYRTEKRNFICITSIIIFFILANFVGPITGTIFLLAVCALLFCIHP